MSYKINQVIPNNISVVIIQSCSQSLAEKVISWALTKQIRVVFMPPHIDKKYLIDIKKHLGNYILIYQDTNDNFLCEINHINYACTDLFDKNPIPITLEHTRKLWPKEKVAFVTFTSGSIGLPKAVCHSFGNVIYSVKYFLNSLNIKPNDKVLTFAPLDTIGGLKFLIISLFKLAQSTIGNIQQPHDWLTILNQIQPDFVLCSPKFIELAIEYEKLFQMIPQAKIYFSGGSHLSQILKHSFEEKFQTKIINGYGTTETCGSFIIDKTGDGFSTNSDQLLDMNLKSLSDTNSVFKLSIQTKSNFLCYLGENIQTNRYYHTGDIIKKNNQKIVFVGRSNRAFKSKDGLAFLQPEILEQYLCNQAEINDAYVTSNVDTSLAPYTCYISSNTKINMKQLKKDIISSIDKSYAQLNFLPAKIIRNTMGKLQTIQETADI
ncbi:AMP-binding protein [bacterium SCSIO 12844]|nr:AMP-binding protein [bacterium SCSIO 12844]